MTEHELNRVRLEIHRALGLQAQPRMGRITAFNPARHSVKVAILPESDFPQEPGDISETGWLPLSPLLAGNGTGVYAPPAIGTQVMVNHQESSAGSGVVIATINDENNVPPGVQAGEFWLQLHNGSKMTVTNDGAVALAAAKQMTHTSTSSVTVAAPQLIANGNSLAGTGATGTLVDASGQTATFRAGLCVNIK
jgi:phage baseplate assembly protein gpV